MSSAERFRIEKCTGAEFAPALAALGAETFTETFGHLYAPEDLAAFVSEAHAVEGYDYLLADPDTALWAAFVDDGTLVGYSVAGRCHLPAPNMGDSAGELRRLYVLKDHQGDGLGRRLLEPALDWLEGRFEEVYLSVYAENHGAQRLYARYGFEIIHEYKFMVGDHADPEFIMKRR